MKRHREDSVSEKDATKSTPLLSNCFPVPFLVRLEHYLDDASLSAMSRCCKRHMILCYFRLSKVLYWGSREILMQIYLDQNHLPTDPFLQMQAAKAIIAELRIKPPNGRNWPFSFRSYMQSVCFETAERIMAGQEAKLIKPQNFHASLILKRDSDAKAVIYLHRGNYDEYIKYRKNNHRLCYLTLALDLGSCEAADPRFVLKEAQLAIDNDIIADDIVLHYLWMVGPDETDFMAIEHKAIFDFFESNELMHMHWITYRLLTSPNRGLERCERLMALDCFNNEEFLDSLPDAYGSLLSPDMDPDNEDHVKKYVKECSSETVWNEAKALLTYKESRQVTQERLRIMLPHLRHLVDGEIFIKLQGLLNL